MANLGHVDGRYVELGHLNPCPLVLEALRALLRLGQRSLHQTSRESLQHQQAPRTMRGFSSTSINPTNVGWASLQNLRRCSFVHLTAKRLRPDCQVGKHYESLDSGTAAVSHTTW